MSETKKDKTKKMFSTPVDAQIITDFKQSCSNLNIPMNTVLEIFMKDFCKGKFILTMAKDEELNDLAFTFDVNTKYK
jgi:hypothetical protein